jgi:hypothetical protein
VRLVEDAVKIAAAPACPDVQADAQGGGDGTARVERDAPEPSTLQPADDLAPDPGPSGDVGLAKASPSADDAKDCPDVRIVHVPHDDDPGFLPTSLALARRVPALRPLSWSS